MITQENYELKISIVDESHETYRRIMVPSNYTLAELCRVILKIFYWSGEQQYRFLVKKKNHTNRNTSDIYGVDTEAVILNGFDMLAEDYFLQFRY